MNGLIAYFDFGFKKKFSIEFRLFAHFQSTNKWAKIFKFSIQILAFLVQICMDASIEANLLLNWVRWGEMTST